MTLQTTQILINIRKVNRNFLPLSQMDESRSFLSHLLLRDITMEYRLFIHLSYTIFLVCSSHQSLYYMHI
jgi:hypothetical protein